MINDNIEMQIKSGAIVGKYLSLSGHRLGRFKGDLQKITDFFTRKFIFIGCSSLLYKRL